MSGAHGPSITNGPGAAGSSSPSPSSSSPTGDAAREPIPLPPSGKHVGATVIDGAGVELRVWAPNAKAVAVVGEAAAPLARVPLVKEDGGFFAAKIATAHAGQKYQFEVTGADGQVTTRVDPRSRWTDAETNSSIIVDPRAYTWSTKAFTPPKRDRAIVYEMHIGSFYSPSNTPSSGTFTTAAQKMDALAELGVNAIELMPVNGHGSHGWGYNPQAYFAPHASYGSPDEMRALVDAAHARGIAVILDIVFNHYDNYAKAPLRCFDGQCPDGSAGIYFFDADPYKKTPWGPRPDFAKKEVSDFFADNLFMWTKEYRVDGYRHDSVSNIRAIDGNGTVPGGSDLLRRLNDVTEKALPGSLLIAEDLKGFASVTAESAKGGLGFDAQWDGGFQWAITSAVSAGADEGRDLGAVKNALLGSYNGDPFQRLLYVESHDTAGNDGARLPVKIDGANPTSLAARKRTMLAAGVLFTAPGVPMIFQGQEMLESTKFLAQPSPLDWTKIDPASTDHFKEVRSFHRDLIRLRKDADGVSSALAGSHITVTHLNDTGGNKVIAYRRWSDAKPGDDMIVIANFGAKKYTRYDVGLPADGAWVARIDSDDVRYGSDFGAKQATPVTVAPAARDGLPFTGSITLGSYAIVVLGR